MAFDGLTVSCITNELKNKLVGGRISKIAQPENDELIITIKNVKEQYRLLISANASLPLIYLTSKNKQSPMTAPGFCMLLRKYIGNGKITDISQPGLERVINIRIEHLSEMGDLCEKVLIVELMGKHSNIIFCDDNNKIIDSIKHIGSLQSSVRTVLPGKDYFIPETTNKLNPLQLSDNFEGFKQIMAEKACPLPKAIYSSLTGISPLVASDIVNLTGLNADMTVNDLADDELYHLFNTINNYLLPVAEHSYNPVIYYNADNEPVDYCALPLSIFPDMTSVHYEFISDVLEKFYAEKNLVTRIKQRSTDLRQIVSTALSKSSKKYDLQLKQLKDTEKRDKYKVYGELITAYGYGLEEGSKELKCTNYYDGNEITIPLDSTIKPIDNAKKYFDKYNKLKRTYDALSEIVIETKNEIEHLDSINTALLIATSENDLNEIREELVNFGYIKRKSTDKKIKYKSKPLHFTLNNGFEIYVGKNNYQNEEVSFKIATGNDWWFHTKTIPGSHVVVKCNNAELPDDMFELAASLAAYYSKARDQQKVEIDYTQKKQLKRVAKAAPGFVIYHTNYSMVASPKSPEELGLEALN